jgi:hypothetical protein
VMVVEGGQGERQSWARYSSFESKLFALLDCTIALRSSKPSLSFADFNTISGFAYGADKNL